MELLRIYTYSAVLILLALGMVMDPARAGVGSGLTIENPVFDAGTVIEGAALSHCFTLKNTGKAPLEILKIIPDCGCTGVEFDNTIPPSRSGTLRVTFHTLDKTGKQVTAVKIYSSDDKKPVKTVKIIAHVLEAVSVKPDRIFFSGLTGRAREKEIRITTPGNAPFGLTVEKKMLPTGIEFRLEKHGMSYRAVFKNRAPVPGIFRGRVILKTSLGPRPYITIPVLARVCDPVKKQP